jgi:biotin operon repressor
MSKKLSYTTIHSVDNDIELYKSAVLYYSSTRVLRGLNSSMLRTQLVNLLALYVKYGYSRDSRKKSEAILGITEGTVNTYNKDLRDLGYLIDDDMNKHHKHLHQELKDLQTAIESAKDSNENIYLFHTVFAIKLNTNA